MLAIEGAANDEFGGSVAVNHGDKIVVGAGGNDDNGAQSGSAYVFTRTGTVWSLQAKLTASDRAADKCF